MDFATVLVSSFQRAPWGWGLLVTVILALIHGWPALTDAGTRARAARSADRKTRYDAMEERIGLLEQRLEKTVNALHEAEMKLVSALAAYRLVIGELQKIDPDNTVLKQAQALLNVSYPADGGNGAREMVRETHAANHAREA